MRKEMFHDFKVERRSKRKWLLFPISFLLHAFVVGAVVIVPLMSDNISGPPIKVVRLISVPGLPAPPPPPPPAPAKRASSKKRVKPKAKPRPAPVQTQRLIPPVQIPEDIEIDEDGIDEGFDDGLSGGNSDGGVVGGVVGGVDGGVVGGVIGGSGNAPVNGPIRVTSVERPNLLKKVTPNYPTMALKAKIQGVVIVEAVTTIYGKVADVRVISGHPLLKAEAVRAVKQWVYEPYMVNGNPMPVKFTATVRFGLQNG